MRKILALGFLVVFALSIMIGAMITPAQAKPPIPCTWKCINGDTYFCCLYPKIGEVCKWDHAGCP
jgi:hypothetical protein